VSFARPRPRPPRLLDRSLVAHRPWQPGNPDGVWQLLPAPPRQRPDDRPKPDTDHDGANASVHIAAVLAQLGIAADRRNPAEADRR
jgi:hypothetical protein